jgi:integrase/recombinase XerC
VYWTLRYRKLSKVHFHLHRCRHTFACNLAKQGADIMTIKNLMGHTSIVMTERYLRSIGLKNGRDFINRMSFS